MNIPTSTTTLGRFAPTLAVPDMAKATAFYRHAFGLEATFQNGDPIRFAILKRDAAELHLTFDAAHQPRAVNVAHLLVDDVDAVHASCQSAGGTIVSAIRSGVGANKEDAGLRAFVVADPFGNRIDVGQPQ